MRGFSSQCSGLSVFELQVEEMGERERERERVLKSVAFVCKMI